MLCAICARCDASTSSRITTQASTSSPRTASGVAATPDPVRGDEVLACVVLRDDVDASQRAQIAQSIVQHALAQLAYYKAPGYVAFVDALPLTTSQKVQRGELRTMAAALVGQANCVATVTMKKRPT